MVLPEPRGRLNRTDNHAAFVKGARPVASGRCDLPVAWFCRNRVAALDRTGDPSAFLEICAAGRIRQMRPTFDTPYRGKPCFPASGLVSRD